MDLALHQKVEEVHAQRPRKQARVADVLAVIDRESGGVPIFRGTEPLFKANVHAASKISGVPEADVLKVMTLIGGQYGGQVAKFRCEPGYWQWAQKFDKVFKPEERLLLSCSFGLGQKMSRWLVSGSRQDQWLSLTRSFMSNIATQILYVCGDLDALLVAAKGDRALAFTRYNAGSSATEHNPAYKTYGLPVAAQAERFAVQLQEK